MSFGGKFEGKIWKKDGIFMESFLGIKEAMIAAIEEKKNPTMIWSVTPLMGPNGVNWSQIENQWEQDTYL